MTRTITINGKEIELHEHPKHRAVLQVQGIMTTWMMGEIDISKLDPNMELKTAIKHALMENPNMATEIEPMQRMLPFDQTIMLSTNMSYKELQKLNDEITEAEFRELYEASCDAIGGTADYFFGYYDSGMSGTTMTDQVKSQPEPKK